MKNISIAIILTLLIASFAACNSNSDVLPSSNATLDSSNDSQFVQYDVAGYITDITTSGDKKALGSIKVEGSKNNGAKNDKAVVTVTPDTKIYMSELTDFDALEVGMYVNIFFTGPVKESYPVQADAKQINVIPDDPGISDNDTIEEE